MLVIRILTYTLVFSILGGCSLFDQQYITGSPMIFAIDRSGFIREREEHLAGNPVTEADVITVTLNTLFLKHIKQEAELKGNQILVYAEVLDTVEESNPQRVVLFNQRHQPDESFLGLADRVIYGPAKFKGQPLRIQLFVVELDKEDNAFKKQMLDSIGGIITTANPTQAAVVEPGIALGKLFAAFDDDDFELRVDFTLHPWRDDPLVTRNKLSPKQLGVSKDDPRAKYSGIRGNYLNTPLREGHYLISKRESPKRFDFDEDLTPAQVIETSYEYLPGKCFTYEKDELPGMEGGDYVLSYRGGYLYLDRVKNDCKEDKWKLGETVMYTEKTYAVISVRTGGAASDEAKRRQVSQKYSEQIQGLLQTTQHETIMKLTQELGAVTSGVLSADKVIDAQNDIVARDPEYRNDPDFVVGMINKLISVEPSGEADKIIAKQHNEQLINAIESTTQRFPLNHRLSADDWAAIVQTKTKAGQDGAVCHKKYGIFVWQDPPSPCSTPATEPQAESPDETEPEPAAGET